MKAIDIKNAKLNRQGVRDLNGPQINARGPQGKLWGKHYHDWVVVIDEDTGDTVVRCQSCYAVDERGTR